MREYFPIKSADSECLWDVVSREDLSPPDFIHVDDLTTFLIEASESSPSLERACISTPYFIVSHSILYLPLLLLLQQLL